MTNDNRKQRLLEVIQQRQGGIILVLEDIHDPHNFAAILRSADAFGIQQIYCVFEKEKAYNPRRVGRISSDSANKWLDFEIFRSTNECVQKLKSQDCQIYVSALSEDVQLISDVNFVNRNMAIVLGNEHDGVSELFCASADVKFKIPMHGMVQSLNVSVAAAISLYEITRQRNESNFDFKLSRDAQNNLFDKWTKKR